MKIWFPILALGLCLTAGASTGWAVVLIDTVAFPIPLEVKDTQSGNAVNGTVTHSLSALSSEDIRIAGATLALTHRGNLNEGPVREVWDVLSPSGYSIGRLSSSEPHEHTDSWQLPAVLLEEITTYLGGPWALGLMEQTSFNGEKIEVLTSELRLEYERNAATTIPEPGTFSLMLGTLATLRVFRSLSGNAWQPEKVPPVL